MLQKLSSLLLFCSILLIYSSCTGSFSKGEKLFLEQEYEKAISEFSRVLFFNVQHVRALHLRARAYEELEQLKKAQEDYEKILQIDPNYAQAHAGLGKIQWELKEYQKAENYLLTAVRNDENDYETLFLLSRALLINGRFESADEFFDIARKINDEDSRLHYYQGMARAQLGNALGAIYSFNRCINLDPTNIPARFNLGLIRLKLGQFRFAQEDFKVVLNNQPEHWEALAQMGRAKQYLKDPSACIDLQRSADNGNENAKRFIRECR